MIETIETWLYTVGNNTPYLIVFLVLLATGFGFPLPEDVIILVAGYLCGIGSADPWLMFPMVFVTIMAADAVIFYLGRRYGHHVSSIPILRRYITPERLLRMEHKLVKHGGKFIFVARFMPGVRTAAMFAAGVLKVRYVTFLLYDGAAAALSVPLIFFAAYFGADHIQRVKHFVAQSQFAIGLLAFFIAAAVTVWYFYRKRQRHNRLLELLHIRHQRNGHTPHDTDGISDNPKSPG